LQNEEVIENMLPFLHDSNKDIKKDARAALICQFQIMGSEKLESYRVKLTKMVEEEGEIQTKINGIYGLMSIV
jgi:hypothetical protein